MSSNSLSLTNIKNGIYNYLYLINENGEIENIRDLLSSLSSLTNPRFTGGIGINLRNGIDTNDLLCSLEAKDMTIHKHLESDLGLHLTHLAVVKAMELNYVAIVRTVLQLISHILT